MSARYLIVIVCFLGLVLSGCSPHKALLSTGDKGLAKELEQLPGLQSHQWGFALYDPEQSAWLYQRSADQYFTPASNTKILTFAAAKSVLGSRTRALHYRISGDTLYFTGTGDPSFLYPAAQSDTIIQFLQSHDGPKVLLAGKPVVKYGPGWAWDDYGYAFQVERSRLPIYGNRVKLEQAAPELPLTVTPSHYKDYVVLNPDLDATLYRLPEANGFEVNVERFKSYPFETSVPFICSEYDLAAILTELTGDPISVDYDKAIGEEYLVLDGVPIDSLYVPLMQDSDNFIAEQLLLQIASARQWPMDFDLVLDSLRTFDFFQNGTPPDEAFWYDGSGLSRYNLLTPRSFVWVLDNMLEHYGQDYLETIFPAGGKNGTIAEWYGGASAPFVFAKTGTMRNRHALSGYIRARSGKLLVFSFMHSNFTGASASVKEEIAIALNYIHEHY